MKKLMILAVLSLFVAAPALAQDAGSYRDQQPTASEPPSTVETTRDMDWVREQSTVPNPRGIANPEPQAEKPNGNHDYDARNKKPADRN